MMCVQSRHALFYTNIQMTSILFFVNMCNIDTLVQFDHTEMRCLKLNQGVF